MRTKSILLGLLLVLPHVTAAGTPRRMFLRMIAAPTAARANQVVECLRSGEAFRTLAHSQSIDPSSSRGGYLGELWLEKMNPDFKRVAAALRPGEFSAPFRSGKDYIVLFRLPTDFRFRAHHLQEKGEQLMEHGKIEEARKLFRESLEIYPDSIHGYFLLAVAAGRQGHLREENRDYRKALAIEGQYHQAHYNLGLALMKEGDAAGAVVELKKALEIKPDLVNCYVSLATVYQSLGRTQDAVAAARKGTEINPLRPSGYYNLGVALLDRNPSQALQQFRIAARLAPERTDFQMTEAVVTARLGNLAGARRKLEAILKKQPGFKPAREALRQIEKQ